MIIAQSPFRVDTLKWLACRRGVLPLNWREYPRYRNQMPSCHIRRRFGILKNQITNSKKTVKNWPVQGIHYPLKAR